MKAVLVSALVAVTAAAGTAQPPPPQLSPETAELAKRFPYPVIRDLRGVIPPGPRPLPSPPLGAGPWVYSTFEQRDIKVSVVTTGLSHPASRSRLLYVLTDEDPAALLRIEPILAIDTKGTKDTKPQDLTWENVNGSRVGIDVVSRRP